MTSSGAAGTPRRVSLAAYSVRVWSGLLVRNAIRRPAARRAAMALGGAGDQALAEVDGAVEVEEPAAIGELGAH